MVWFCSVICFMEVFVKLILIFGNIVYLKILGKELKFVLDYNVI